jgi:hypothetical protein
VIITAFAMYICTENEEGRGKEPTPVVFGKGIFKGGNRLKTPTTIIALAGAVILAFGCQPPSIGNPPPAGTKSITEFSIPALNVAGVIDETSRIISLSPISRGTDLSNLVALFETNGKTVTVNSVDQTSGITVNDFRYPVTYRVTAENNSTRDYIVVALLALQDADWARTLASDSDNGSSKITKVTVDANGDVYAAGFIHGKNVYDFGTNVAVTGGFSSTNCLLVKYDATGAAQWARTVAPDLSDAGHCEFTDVAVDSSGNVFAVGYINGGLFTFGPNASVSSSGSPDEPVIVKYDSQGEAQWARTISSSVYWSAWFKCVAVDGQGNSYAGGFITGGTTYRFGTVDLSGPNDMMHRFVAVVKFDPQGNAIWARSVASGAESSYKELKTDGQGNLLAVGDFEAGTFNFGSGVTAPISSSRGIVKYDADGNSQWAKDLTPCRSSARIAVESDGDMYLVSSVRYGYSSDFGNGVTVISPCPSSNGAVLVKYDADGAAQWAKTIEESTAGSSYYDVGLDSNGNPTVVGVINYQGIYTFAPGVIVKGSGIEHDQNIVLVNYDTLGNFLSVNRVCPDFYVFSLSCLAVSLSRDLYLGGWIYMNNAYHLGTNSNAVMTGPSNATYHTALVKYPGD